MSKFRGRHHKHLMRRFGREKRGSMPILFGVMSLPLIGLTGGVIDYGRSVADRHRLNNAIDAALIVAGNQVQADDAANLDNATIIKNAQAAATAYFNSTPKLPSGASATFKVTIQNRDVTVDGAYTAVTPTTLLKVIGIQQFTQSNGNVAGTGSGAGTATSTGPSVKFNLSPMVDIYLLIDVSASMAIGATTADITKLRNNFGCAFACHDGVKVKNTQMDTFEWAQSKGIKLRINEINQGIVDFVNWLKSQSSVARRIRIAVSAFDTTLDTLVPITADLDRALSNLPQTPSASGTYDGATHFRELMPGFAQNVGTGGDGITAPKKLVIIATDGVQDPNRTWADKPALRPQVAPFDPAACRNLSSSISVSVLYAPYIQMPWDWGYNATLGQPSLINNSGTRFDDIIPQLKSCATAANLFIDISTTTSVGAAFVNVFQSFSTIRLAR